jgi:hypothetical protein
LLRHDRELTRSDDAIETRQEMAMSETSHGVNVPPYGVLIREKIKSGADLQTLQAYRTVAHDLLQGASGPEADGLRASLGDLDKAIKAKGG